MSTENTQYIINKSEVVLSKKQLNEDYPRTKDGQVVILPNLSLKYIKLGPYSTSDWEVQEYKIVS